MIQLVKRLYKVISIFKIKLLKKLNSERTEVYIFDLDNTLYDTWRYLENKDYSNLYLSIPIFRGMKKEIMGKSNKNTLIFFLTARRLKFLKVTKKRLKQDFPDINWHLFMVDKAQEKIDYLQRICTLFKKVSYFDDLSFNQENGEIKFYENVIKEINRLNLTYYNYQLINKINEENI